MNKVAFFLTYVRRYWIILIYCFTYAALRRFPAVAVHQTLSKAEKQKDTERWIGKKNTHKNKFNIKVKLNSNLN